MEKRKTGIKNIAPYAYITPITLILVTFVIGSVIISVVLGFTKYNIMTEPVFSGLDNYRRLLTDSKFIKALKNTLELIVIIVPLQTVSGILVSSFLVAGVVWREFLNGKLPVVENFFGLFGIEPSMLLGDARKALIVVGLVAVWKYMGYYVVIYSSGLLSISDTYYEAAKVDGAGRIRCFFSITLPMLKPTIILAVFLSLTNSPPALEAARQAMPWQYPTCFFSWCW